MARGLRRRHWGQAPDGWMEQAMGYSGAVGTMLMDEMAGVCGRAEERFTGIRTDIGKLETELLKAWDWSACQDVVQPSRLLPSLLSPTQVVPHTPFIL